MVLASFYMRAYRLPPEGQVHCFEVDAPEAQTLKRELLAQAGATGVTCVSTDFLEEDSFEKLAEAVSAVGIVPPG